MATESSPKPPHLEPSPLGTKEYWDELYTTEIQNHGSDNSDVGTIWFDDCSAEDRVVKYLRGDELRLDRLTTSFLDLGTGNGHFLFRLRKGEEDEDDEEEEDILDPTEEGTNVRPRDPRFAKNEGFMGPMLGVDYSTKSVEFANLLAMDTHPSPPTGGPLEFIQYDILTSPPSLVLQRLPKHRSYETPEPKTPHVGYDVVLDKGTFDAISLSGELFEDGRRVFEDYKDRVLPLVENGGYFVIVSCNWTEEEIIGWFIGSDQDTNGPKFKVHGRVPFGSFIFGGKKGQSINCVCFKKLGGSITAAH